MIYLKVRNNRVEAFSSMEVMRDVTNDENIEPDLTIDDATWEKHQAQAYIKNGEIILGRSKEQLFELLRLERNNRIAETDYMFTSDYPISEESKKVMATYRQALRDITNLDGAPWDGGGDLTPWPKYPKLG